MTDELQISERERDILRLIATGATNQQIASQLSISINTVKVHVRNIYEKLGVVSRTEATLYAVRAGLVPVGTMSAAQAEALGQPLIAVEDEPLEPAATLPALPAPVALAEPEPVAEPSLPAPAVPVPGPVAGARARRGTLLGGGLLALVVLAGLVLAVVQPWRAPASAPSSVPSAGATAATIALPNPDQRWRELAALPEARFGFALAPFRFDGRSYFYAIGGEVGGQVDGSVLRYDLEANAWVEFNTKPTPVTEAQAVVIGNRIFVPGGRIATGEISGALEAYDPQRDRWESLAPLPEPRAGYALAAVEGKLYLFGGSDGSQPRAEVWQYSPDRDEWQPQTALSEPRSGAGTAVIADEVFILGGENAQGALTIHQRYNPAEEGVGNPYTIRAPLPEPRSRVGTAIAGRFLFLFGGSAGASALVYDSASDTWRSNETPLSPDLRDLGAAANGDQLYLFGGRVGTEATARSYTYQALYQVVVPIELGN